jgi:hypothetical protein
MDSDTSAGFCSRINDREGVFQMFDFVVKSLEKRILFNHLSGVGLDLSELDPGIVKQILQVVHQQVTSVSKKYKQPVPIIAEDIIHSAAWAIAYCLLGPSKLLDVYPEFKDRTDEAEMELLLLENGDRLENNIYKQIFAILLVSPCCHHEVSALRGESALVVAAPDRTLFDNSNLLFH